MSEPSPPRQEVGLFMGLLIFACLVVVALDMALFPPHPYPALQSTFWWGVLHGFNIVTNFLISLIDDEATVYQHAASPDYRNGFIVGVTMAVILLASMFIKLIRDHRRTRP